MLQYLSTQIYYNQKHRHLLFTSQNLKPAHFHNGFPIAKNKTKLQLAQIVQHYLVIAQAALRSTHHFQTQSRKFTVTTRLYRANATTTLQELRETCACTGPWKRQSKKTSLTDYLPPKTLSIIRVKESGKALRNWSVVPEN